MSSVCTTASYGSSSNSLAPLWLWATLRLCSVATKDERLPGTFPAALQYSNTELNFSKFGLQTLPAILSVGWLPVIHLALFPRRCAKSHLETSRRPQTVLSRSAKGLVHSCGFPFCSSFCSLWQWGWLGCCRQASSGCCIRATIVTAP